jgi:hypothetical protein
MLRVKEQHPQQWLSQMMARDSLEFQQRDKLSQIHKIQFLLVKDSSVEDLMMRTLKLI